MFSSVVVVVTVMVSRFVGDDGSEEVVRRLSDSSISSSGRRRGVVGLLPPSPAVCGTRGRRASECWPSSTHSSTADTWHWHRRTGQTCLRSVHPGIRHTSDHPARTASPPPASSREQCYRQLLWIVKNLCIKMLFYTKKIIFTAMLVTFPFHISHSWRLEKKYKHKKI